MSHTNCGDREEQSETKQYRDNNQTQCVELTDDAVWYLLEYDAPVQCFYHLFI